MRTAGKFGILVVGAATLSVIAATVLSFTQEADKPYPAFGSAGAVIVGLAGLLGSLASVWLGSSSPKTAEAPKEQQPSLPKRIDLLRDNLKASNAIIEEITAELNLQVASLDRIRAEAEQNRALAALHQDEADAVAKLMEATIHRAQNQTATTSKRTQWWFFAGGLLLGIPLSVFANFVYDLMK